MKHQRKLLISLDILLKTKHNPNVNFTRQLKFKNHYVIKIQQKRPKKAIEKFDKINEILSECDNLQPDLQFSSHCSVQH